MRCLRSFPHIRNNTNSLTSASWSPSISAIRATSSDRTRCNSTSASAQSIPCKHSTIPELWALSGALESNRFTVAIMCGGATSWSAACAFAVWPALRGLGGMSTFGKEIECRRPSGCFWKANRKAMAAARRSRRCKALRVLAQALRVIQNTQGSLPQTKTGLFIEV